MTRRGEVAGCFLVQHAGYYGYAYIYGANGGDSLLPGFAKGEALAFRINGVVPTASEALTWANDLTPHAVDLAVEVYPVYLSVVLR